MYYKSVTFFLNVSVGILERHLYAKNHLTFPFAKNLTKLPPRSLPYFAKEHSTPSPDDQTLLENIETGQPLKKFDTSALRYSSL